MVRVDIESIVMATGPVPSVVVLRERRPSSESDAPLRALSIQTGSYEAAAIGGGMDQTKSPARPIAHDLLLATVQQLGAKVERVEIRHWDAPVFYADVVLGRDGIDCPDEREDAEGGDRESLLDSATAGDASGGRVGETGHPSTDVRRPHQLKSNHSEIRIDARPSDAIALAARSNAPIYVEDDVMNRAGSISLQSNVSEGATEKEIERFDEFVQNLSPDDF